MFDTDAERYQAYMYVTFEGLAFHQNATFVEVNDQFAQMFGYAPDELIGEHIYKLFSPDSVPVVQQHVDGETLSIYAATGRRRDGSTFPIRISARNVETAHGPARVAAVRDITEDKEARAALETARKRMRDALLETIDALARTVEMRDPFTDGHQDRTARIAAAIAAQLGVHPVKIQAINLGAVIHDIGKVAIPNEILTKPAPLDGPEFELVKTHCEKGYGIVKDIEMHPSVADIVRHHHERLDGTGYPDGLSGDEISLEVRIVTVADVLEAMTSQRPHRPAYSRAETFAHLDAHAGAGFDAEVVAAAHAAARDGALEPVLPAA